MNLSATPSARWASEMQRAAIPEPYRQVRCAITNSTTLILCCLLLGSKTTIPILYCWIQPTSVLWIIMHVYFILSQATESVHVCSKAPAGEGLNKQGAGYAEEHHAHARPNRTGTLPKHPSGKFRQFRLIFSTCSPVLSLPRRLDRLPNPVSRLHWYSLHVSKFISHCRRGVLCSQ
jgi:hypothetical protein